MINLESTWYKDEKGNIKSDESVFNKIYSIMNKLKQEGNVFAGKRNRLDFANSAFLIKYENEEIGFIYITKESRYKDALFIDMAIIKEYRGKGIGKLALKQFLEEVQTKAFIIGETKITNEASNPLGNDLGIKILEDKYDYYLFPKSRYEEFLKFNKDKEFEKAMSKEALNSNELLHQVYEEEKIKTKKLIKNKLY